MKITTMSQNLQGLNDDAFVEVVKNYYRRHIKDIEILCFQEHKLRGIKLQMLKDKIWRGAKYFSVEVDVAYNNTPDGPRASICMWISPSIQYLVSSYGQSRSGCAQWVRVSGTPGGDLAILNVYAPNNPAARCTL
jgi:hypothetical protein